MSKGVHPNDKDASAKNVEDAAALPDDESMSTLATAEGVAQSPLIAMMSLAKVVVAAAGARAMPNGRKIGGAGGPGFWEIRAPASMSMGCMSVVSIK